MFKQPSLIEAQTIYKELENTVLRSFTSARCTPMPYKDLPYKELRRLMFTADYVPLQIRENAYVAFIVRANTTIPMHKFISNSKLLKVLHTSLKTYDISGNILIGNAKKTEATNAYRVSKHNATVQLDSWDKAYIKNIYLTSKWLSTFCKPYHVDHIIPLAKGGLHTPDNLQILPAEVNCSKGANLYD